MRELLECLGLQLVGVVVSQPFRSLFAVFRLDREGLCCESRRTFGVELRPFQLVRIISSLALSGLCLGSDEFVVNFLHPFCCWASALDYPLFRDSDFVHYDDYAGSFVHPYHSWKDSLDPIS